MRTIECKNRSSQIYEIVWFTVIYLVKSCVGVRPNVDTNPTLARDGVCNRFKYKSRIRTFMLRICIVFSVIHL